MLTGLACGCCDNIRLSEAGFPAVLHCMQGHGMQRITAIDCREWKVKCSDCQFARWCGTSSETAWLAKVSHSRNARHNVTAELTMKDFRAGFIRLMYPQTVKLTVEGFKLPEGFKMWDRPINTVEVFDEPLF